LRLGDRVEGEGGAGVVEEIGLTYTFIRADDGARLVIPNEKLASDTIRNSTIRTREKLAEVTVQVPLSTDLGATTAQLRGLVADERDADVFVRSIEGNATIVLRSRAADPAAAELLEHELRLRAHELLRTQGVYK
jgi:small-conductance mechanosensitive channel